MCGIDFEFVACFGTYRYFHDHFISWDLLAVAFSMVIVKMVMMVWYRFNG